MTSAASQQPQIPALTPSASTATSYASAAGATKKPTSTPLIATGSHPPVVVGSSAAAGQNGKPSASPVNGRPNITPAVPTVSGPPSIVRSSSILNGAAGEHHARKSSVTISANAPSSHISNGGPVGGGKAIPQFGFNESPAVTHSTPQTGGSVPIAIPGGGNPRVTSPAHSPSPIPQFPQQSGGQRAPSNTQAPVTFGSFPGEGDRHMKQHSVSHPAAMGQSPHARRDSQASAHNEQVGHGGPSHGRGGYQGQGRGRGGFNNQYNQTMGYPPSRPYNGPNPGRGGMPPYHQGRGGMQQFPNSPQPPRASPATAPAMPHHGTPTMQTAALATGQQFYSPGMNMYPHQQMNPPYGVVPPPMESYRGGMMIPSYGYSQQPMAYMGQPQQSSPAYHQNFAPAYNQGQPTAPSMSRNASQVSDRPTSSASQSQAPVVAGTPHQRPAQPSAPAIVSSSTFSLPKKSTVVIKSLDGKIVDLSSMKAPASPSPSIQQSKTPPVVASTPTPPPKPSTPSHARSESNTALKTAEQRRNEFKDAVRKSTEGAADTKTDETAKASADKTAADKAAADKAAADKAAADKAAADKAAADKAAADKAAADKAAADKAAAEEKAKEERLAAEKKAAEEAKEKAEADAKAKAEAEKVAKEQEKKDGPLDDDEEMERMIREMEEEDARREKEQEEISRRKKIEAEERKKREEVDRVANAAENDRKLREQEREMERIEEEREQKRKESEAKVAAGKGESVADLLSKKMGSLDISDKKDESAKSSGSPVDAASAKSVSAEKRSKPVPLNLSPLNTKPVEAPQPSAALQSLRSSRFLPGVEYDIYPAGIASPNPALNQAVTRKGKVFRYDAQFLLQFQGVFTEQPSPEFHQQVKSLIGDNDGSRSASARTPGAGSGRQGSRAGGAPGGFPQQGAMGQFGAKALPPGTTSEQRFAMASGSMSRPPSSTTGMGFGRAGAFPPNPMSRTPSSSNAGGIPNSPRGGSRRGPGNSSRRAEFGGKTDAQAAKTMPLTQGLDLKPITVSATGWKPTSIKAPGIGGPPGQPSGHLDPEMVQRKVKAALNKMTPEKFDKIADSILVISSQSKNEQDGRTLRQVIQLTFEKATDEAHWASMYAKFCKCMLETMSPEIRDEGILDKYGNVVSGGALFRKYLLNRCQEEFERGWKVDLPQPKEGEDSKAREAVLLSDEYYIAAAAKRRGLGLVQFIGELFKLGMLTERIMHECVRKLLEFQGIPDEAEIESLTKLLRTVGAALDGTDKGRHMMDAYFQRIDSIVVLPDLPSRLRFMLMDIIDLRKARWASKDGNKGPKTLDEVRAEAEAQAAQKAAENARSNQRGGPGGRAPSGRGDARNFSAYAQPPPNQVQMDDLRRLKATGTRSSSQNIGFGPTSMFSSRSNSGRRLGAPGGAFNRGGEDSGASSRTGTPPTRDSISHTNAFGLLADTGENPASPPSTSASPALSKAALDTAVEKKE